MRIKRMTAALLCVLCLLCMASCAAEESDIPTGMHIASCAGADYRLYVPTTWNLKTDYGVSGAYYNLSNLSNVSVADYPRSDFADRMASDGVATGDTAEELSAQVDWYALHIGRENIEEFAEEGTFSVVEVPEEKQSLTFGDANAKRYEYRAKVAGKFAHVLQVVAIRSQKIYVFSFSAGADMYEMLISDVEKMLSVFRFSEDPYYPEGYAKDDPEGIDVAVPEGMKLASDDDVSYRFFVPQNWEYNRDHSIYAATASDRSSVSVVPYMPETETMSVSEFFELNQKQMIALVGESNYDLLDKTENQVKLGGRNATVYHYTLTVDGVTYEYRQVVAAYKSMIYSLTYTALPENFAKHMAEVDQIIAAFTFR